MIDNEEELRKQLEWCRIDLNHNKGQRQLLEKELKEEDKMRNYLNQQLEKKDEQLATLMNDQGEVKKWRKKVEVAEEIAKVIQDEGLE